jgi:hypothetical protein
MALLKFGTSRSPEDAAVTFSKARLGPGLGLGLGLGLGFPK